MSTTVKFLFVSLFDLSFRLSNTDDADDPD
jgi:hypothetical protein